MAPPRPKTDLGLPMPQSILHPEALLDGLVNGRHSVKLHPRTEALLTPGFCFNKSIIEAQLPKTLIHQCLSFQRAMEPAIVHGVN